MQPVPWDTLKKLSIVTALAAQGYAFWKWLDSHIKNYRMMKRFVVDMHNNHLPHIEHYLKQLCKKADLDFIELEDWRKHGPDTPSDD